MEICPECSNNNHFTVLKLYQINLTTAVYMCPIPECKYPKGHGWKYVERSIDDMLDQNDAALPVVDNTDFLSTLDEWLENLDSVNSSDTNADLTRLNELIENPDSVKSLDSGSDLDFNELEAILGINKSSEENAFRNSTPSDLLKKASHSQYSSLPNLMENDFNLNIEKMLNVFDDEVKVIESPEPKDVFDCTDFAKTIGDIQLEVPEDDAMVQTKSASAKPKSSNLKMFNKNTAFRQSLVNGRWGLTDEENPGILIYKSEIIKPANNTKQS